MRCLIRATSLRSLHVGLPLMDSAVRHLVRFGFVAHCKPWLVHYRASGEAVERLLALLRAGKCDSCTGGDALVGNCGCHCLVRDVVEERLLKRLGEAITSCLWAGCKTGLVREYIR